MNENLKKAAFLIVENQNSSVPFLFSNLKISYKDAIELINELERIKVLGSYYENKEREILVNSINDLEKLFSYKIASSSSKTESLEIKSNNETSINKIQNNSKPFFKSTFLIVCIFLVLISVISYISIYIFSNKNNAVLFTTKIRLRSSPNVKSKSNIIDTYKIGTEFKWK